MTASNFGAVINRRKNVFTTSLLEKVVNPNSKTYTLESCQWGKDNEIIAIEQYHQQIKVTVTICGLIINPKWPWIGYSADGIINSTSGIEVKCPYTKTDMTIMESCEDKTFYLKLDGGQPRLKQIHHYFYQCQGVMAVSYQR